VKKTLLLGGLAASLFCASVAAPAFAHDGEYGYGYSRGNRDFYTRPDSGYGRYDYGYDSRDAKHARKHEELQRKHEWAHERGFYSRREHQRWHERAGTEHDVTHHRLYGDHAPERKAGYRDWYPQDDYRYSGRSGRRYNDRYYR
jgi:hypothetical protein